MILKDDLMEYDIQLMLQTTIVDGDSKEKTVVEEPGKIYMKEHGDMITYEEKVNGDQQAKTKNMITIQPNKVLIRRSGTVKMNQLFHQGKRSESVFHHPHGNIHMETYTNSIDYQPCDETRAGRLAIDYTVKLNGQEARHHFLKLTFGKQE